MLGSQLVYYDITQTHKANFANAEKFDLSALAENSI